MGFWGKLNRETLGQIDTDEQWGEAGGGKDAFLSNLEECVWMAGAPSPHPPEALQPVTYIPWAVCVCVCVHS